MREFTGTDWYIYLLKRAISSHDWHSGQTDEWGLWVVPDFSIEEILAFLCANEGGKEAAVKTLIQDLKSQDRDIRRSAAAWLPSPRIRELAVDPLIRIIKKADDLYASKEIELHVRKLAVEALGKIGDKRATEPITQLVKDDSPDIRCAAVEALGRIGDSMAVEVMIAIVGDMHADQVLQKEARKALTQALKRVPKAIRRVIQAALQGNKQE